MYGSIRVKLLSAYYNQLQLTTDLNMAASLPSLEQQQLPPAQLDQPCDDDHLLELSCSVTRWQSIFPFLGLDETDEESIIEKYPPERRRLEMLRRWKMKFGQAATYRYAH